MADPRGPQWRLLRDGVLDPFLHFAVEEAIVRGVDEGTSPETLRLRQVDPSVFIGVYYQEPDEDVNLAWCEERGIPIIRRQNPGGAVYQDRGSFCYSATFRRDQFERWGMSDAGGLYEKAGRAVVNACAANGATAKARPVNDVEIDGRKVYGSAQLDWYGAFVHSGTFLVHTDIEAMSPALKPSMLKFADKASSSIRERVVNLAEAAGRALQVGHVMSALFTSPWRRARGRKSSFCGFAQVEPTLLVKTETPIDPRCLLSYTSTMPAPVRPPLLGDLENAVMNHLWDGGEGEAKAVHAALGSRRGITLNTIQSTLKRLYEKQLLERDKVSHAHVYAPRVTREQFHRELLGGIVDGLMDRQGEAVVAAFVDLAERAGPEHLARLEALVADRRRKLEGKR
jgi:lipoate-protein ligase A/predicted transcriptional regulator